LSGFGSGVAVGVATGALVAMGSGDAVGVGVSADWVGATGATVVARAVGDGNVGSTVGVAHALNATSVKIIPMIDRFIMTPAKKIERHYNTLSSHRQK
jgi:hypothetical protein